jgi:uncharacterized protein with von Willebrand factor type A (vWA) domain
MPNPLSSNPHDASPLKHAAGVVHSYQHYDPQRFPSPTAPTPDIAGAMWEHMMAYGDLRELTEEELARAVRLDPSMFPQLGPSLSALTAALEERKRRILSTYETASVVREAAQQLRERATDIDPPKDLRQALSKAVREEQLADLERLYHRQKDDSSPFAQSLMRVIDAMGTKYEIEELASAYAFTGSAPLTIPEALDIKQELETIDRLLEQLKEAMHSAQLAIIDMDALSELAEQADIDPAHMQSLNQLQQQIEDYIREEAQRQGLERTRDGFRLTPNALRVFQKKLLSQIFSDLSAARSGRHAIGVAGDGAVELEKTKPYEFGDSAANIDVVTTLLNGVARNTQTSSPSRQPTDRLALLPTDLSIHLTRNNPKCATAIIMDMSGSMRYDGQYINCKRMALAMDGLIRTEFPGDFVGFIEMYSIAKVRRAGELPTLLPKPVSIHAPRVRLKADMSNPRISEMQLPQHFTNIQHALQLARQLLTAQDTPNRQIMLITDGLPTAHFEGQDLYFLYPPDPQTEQATMREAALCAQQGITLNVFLLPSWSQSSEDVQFAHRMAERTKGRVFFTGGRDLDRYVVWDYVKMRRTLIN